MPAKQTSVILSPKRRISRPALRQIVSAPQTSPGKGEGAIELTCLCLRRRPLVRENRTKAKLATGGVAFGVTVGPNDSDMVEMAGLMGFDFAMVDCEHDLFNESALAGLIRTANLYGMTAIARMQNNFELALHALDGGAQGILVARVKSADDAQAIVNATKFQPEGKRTIFFRSRGGGYALDIPSPEQWTLDTNAQIMAGCIMEEIAAVDNIADILAVPGIDFIDLGPLDLSHSKGWVDQAGLDQLVHKIVSESVKAGKAVVSPASADNIPDLLDRGFRMLTVSPVEYFQSGATQFLSRGREILASRGISQL
jgi:4-hydroxy-2-oxoheptanedioate aldolase